MIFDLKDGIFFDNEKLYIIRGEINKREYIQNYDSYPKAIRRHKSATYPTIIFLSSTMCNLRCQYCFAEAGTYGSHFNSKSFTLKKYKYCYEMTRKLYGGVKAINFFGGEPLLNFRSIKAFVEYLYGCCQDEEIPELSIASNGTIMNDAIKEFLVKYKIDFATSLDGIKKHNDKFRKGPWIDSVYDLVGSTLSELNDVGIKTGMQFTVTKEHVVGYEKGDAGKWLDEIETLGVDNYSLVAVTSDQAECKIDLNDRVLCENYVTMCNDMADYYLNLLCKGSACSTNIFPGILLHIMRREVEIDCNAGFSVSISPDMQGFPCHVCADDMDCSCRYDEHFLENIRCNQTYMKVYETDREHCSMCQKCIAYNVCPYFCKGVQVRRKNDEPDERCLMFQIFVQRAIVFLATDYHEHATAVNKAIRMAAGV